MSHKAKYLFFLLAVLLSSCNLIIINPDDTKQHSDTIPEQKEDSIDTRTPDQRRNPDYLYDLDAVPEIIITITEENWNIYLDNFDRNPNNDDYLPAQFEFRKNDDVFKRDSVGLRPRGNTSRRRPEGYTGERHNRNNPDWHHAHFGIRFTKYATGERFFGSDRMVLKWFNNDPSYCREVFTTSSAASAAGVRHAHHIADCISMWKATTNPPTSAFTKW